MGQADELTDEQWREIQIYPGMRYPELPFFDDDWGRFYCKGNRDNVVAYEIHETSCLHDSCAFRPSTPCPFHPADCDCSFGACRDEYDEEAAEENLRLLSEAAKEIGPI